MRLPVNPLPMQKVYRQLSQLLSVIYPPLCTFCDAPGIACMDICSGCHHDLPWNDSACLRCALPLPSYSRDNLICGSCLKNEKQVFCDQAWAAFMYKSEIPWLITHLKFRNRLGHGRLLGELMWQQLEQPCTHNPGGQPDVIIPVPLHPSRIKERGFNQALEITRPIARYSGIRMDARCLVRTQNTLRQSDLSQSERKQNMRNAFETRKALTGLHVVLVDDVMTSGNTINAAAKALKQAGAARVSAWVAARAALQAI